MKYYASHGAKRRIVKLIKRRAALALSSSNHFAKKSRSVNKKMNKQLRNRYEVMSNTSISKGHCQISNAVLKIGENIDVEAASGHFEGTIIAIHGGMALIEVIENALAVAAGVIVSCETCRHVQVWSYDISDVSVCSSFHEGFAISKGGSEVGEQNDFGWI